MKTLHSAAFPPVWSAPRRRLGLRSLVPVLLGVLATLILVAAIRVVTALPVVVDYKADLGASTPHELAPDPIDPSWIVSGAPTFESTVFDRSAFWGTSSGIWQATGPGTFVWHYSVDEAIYVLEGEATIEYEGRTFTIHPGESTHFVAGTTAKWVVNDRIKKTFRIQQPGRLVRWMRALLG